LNLNLAAAKFEYFYLVETVKAKNYC